MFFSVILFLLAIYFIYKTRDARNALRQRCAKERKDYIEKNIKEIVKEGLLEYYSGNIPKEMQDLNDSTDDKDSKAS